VLLYWNGICHFVIKEVSHLFQVNAFGINELISDCGLDFGNGERAVKEVRTVPLQPNSGTSYRRL
jgi:hypothetical protein